MEIAPSMPHTNGITPLSQLSSEGLRTNEELEQIQKDISSVASKNRYPLF